MEIGKTRFQQLVDIMAKELARPSDPAALLAAHAEFLQMGPNPPVIHSARNTLLEKARKAAEQKRREEAAAKLARIQAEKEATRQARIAADTQEIEVALHDFNQALENRDLGCAIDLVSVFHQARLQKALLDIAGGFEEREVFFSTLIEKIENVQQRIEEDAAVEAEQAEFKARAKMALVGPSVGSAANGHTRTLHRTGKTARDHQSGAWKQRLDNVAARRTAGKTSGNGQKGGKKKGKK